VIYSCCNPRRRALLRDTTPPGGAPLNGIDFLEVLDDPALPDAVRQRTLFLHFVKPLVAPLTAADMRIEGGERIRDVAITGVTPGEADNVLAVTVDQPGDFSTYTLRLVKDAMDRRNTLPPDGIDPVLAAVDFSFKAACATDFDCPTPACPPEQLPEPQIDYLAKDYASFRRLMLDRMATLMPAWRERNPAAVEIALVELLAYVGDQLSYRQDAVATEAYLGTARRRVSVRRHARLLDYPMHDGCNARAWVQIRVDRDLVKPSPTAASPLPRGTRLLTHVPNQPDRIDPDPLVLQAAVAAGAEVFETMEDADALYAAHNTLDFYTWGDEGCCLPSGATRATLAEHRPNLKQGDVLVLVERIGPRSGHDHDADPAHRHAVRLTAVRAFAPDSTTPLADPLTGQQITEVEWHDADRLPLPLCISARADPEHGGDLLERVSVALGNVVPPTTA
jgi:hypothetical protein